VKQLCVYLDDSVSEALAAYKKSMGVSKVWVANEALRVLMNLNGGDGLYIKPGKELMGKLREVCVSQGKTIGEVVGEILKEGLA